MEKLKGDRLPRFERAKNPPPMRFGRRDLEILKTIYAFDGMLAKRQVKRLFWAGKSTKAMEARLSKLFHNGFLNWPNAYQRRANPFPEPIVWLGWQGILEVAGSLGINIVRPKIKNENQMRLLQSRLRNQGIRWLRKPNWNQLQHDIALADFRMQISICLSSRSNLEIAEWIPESTFRTETDVVRFSYTGKNGQDRKRSKGVCPDSALVVNNKVRAKLGKPHRAILLIEIDMATHDSNSFGIEKAAAGSAYIQSPQYKKRFGSNSGRWLVLTTGEQRMKHLLEQTAKQAGKRADLFFFATLENAISKNPLVDPIWSKVGDSEPEALPFA